MLTYREWRAARKAAWESMQGCTCRALRKVGGKIVRVPATDLCTKQTIRCEGRARRWARDVEKLGPEPAKKKHPAKPEGE